MADADADSAGVLDLGGITPFALGPDGGTAPYVYWDVRDTDGNLVPGATFQFSYRSGGSWTSGNNANPLSDCAGICGNTSLDRDTDGGEFLLEHRATNRNATNRLSTSANYRVTPVAAPVGYAWVSTSAVSINGNSNSADWSANGGTFYFGTFQVVPNAPTCQSGYVYGVTAAGQLRRVAPDGSIIDIGSPASGVSSFNGLGIGTNGTPVLAYERNSSANQLTVWEFNAATGVWASKAHSINSTTSSRTVAFVGGAVNYLNGRFYVGGFTTASDAFRIWEYNPTTNTSTFKGSITTPTVSAGNGDLAFDDHGNLFIVRGAGTQMAIFSVAAADLAAASGGTIPSSMSSTFTIINNVNGVAFDFEGRVYSGSSTELRSYDTPNWTNAATVVASGFNTTDLASCTWPPTITLEKYVEDARVAVGDQFALTLAQDGQTSGSATTTGTASGPQGQRVGPLPTVRGSTFTFTETASGTTNFANYATSYRCEVDGVPDPAARGDGRTGTVTIPSTGQAVLCRFHNAPLRAAVRVSKTVLDVAGANPQPGVGWTVGAARSATTGTVTATPTATTQTTNALGQASWTLTFGTPASRATVTVSETQQPGYEFVSGSCTITALSGAVRTVTLTGAGATALTGVAPADVVECGYVNKLRPSTLTLVKQVSLGSAAPEAWTLTATGPGGALPGPSGVTGSSGATGIPITADVGYALAEDDPIPTYVSTGWTCAIVAPADAVGALAVVAGTVTVPRPGLDVTCTVVNATAHVTLLKQVRGDAVFGPADFRLTATPASGPVLNAESVPGAPVASEDNTVEVRPGHTYTLSEDTPGAPSLAYRNAALQVLAFGADPAVEANWTTLGSPDVTVAAGEHRLYRFVNEPVPAIVLPLTGGAAADAFLLGGSSVLAIALALGLWPYRRGSRIGRTT